MFSSDSWYKICIPLHNYFAVGVVTHFKKDPEFLLTLFHFAQVYKMSL